MVKLSHHAAAGCLLSLRVLKGSLSLSRESSDQDMSLPLKVSLFSLVVQFTFTEHVLSARPRARK